MTPQERLRKTIGAMERALNPSEWDDESYRDSSRLKYWLSELREVLKSMEEAECEGT